MNNPGSPIGTWTGCLIAIWCKVNSSKVRKTRKIKKKYVFFLKTYFFYVFCFTYWLLCRIFFCVPFCVPFLHMVVKKHSRDKCNSFKAKTLLRSSFRNVIKLWVFMFQWDLQLLLVNFVIFNNILFVFQNYDQVNKWNLSLKSGKFIIKNTYVKLFGLYCIYSKC